MLTIFNYIYYDKNFSPVVCNNKEILCNTSTNEHVFTSVFLMDLFSHTSVDYKDSYRLQDFIYNKIYSVNSNIHISTMLEINRVMIREFSKPFDKYNRRYINFEELFELSRNLLQSSIRNHDFDCIHELFDLVSYSNILLREYYSLRDYDKKYLDIVICELFVNYGFIHDLCLCEQYLEIQNYVACNVIKSINENRFDKDSLDKVCSINTALINNTAGIVVQQDLSYLNNVDAINDSKFLVDQLSIIVKDNYRVMPIFANYICEILYSASSYIKEHNVQDIQVKNSYFNIT